MLVCSRHKAHPYIRNQRQFDTRSLLFNGGKKIGGSEKMNFWLNNQRDEPRVEKQWKIRSVDGTWLCFICSTTIFLKALFFRIALIGARQQPALCNQRKRWKNVRLLLAFRRLLANLQSRKYSAITQQAYLYKRYGSVIGAYTFYYANYAWN